MSTDTWNIRLVIIALGLIVLTSIAGIVYLISQGRDPGDLKLLASAALGGLTAILATTRSTVPAAYPNPEPEVEA